MDVELLYEPCTSRAVKSVSITEHVVNSNVPRELRSAGMQIVDAEFLIFLCAFLFDISS